MSLPVLVSVFFRKQSIITVDKHLIGPNGQWTLTVHPLDWGLILHSSETHMDIVLIYIFFLLKRVESFLHKDVNFVVTGNKEGLDKKSIVSKGGASQSAQQLIKQRPGTPRPMVLYLLLSLSVRLLVSYQIPQIYFGRWFTALKPGKLLWKHSNTISLKRSNSLGIRVS